MFWQRNLKSLVERVYRARFVKVRSYSAQCSMSRKRLMLKTPGRRPGRDFKLVDLLAALRRIAERNIAEVERVIRVET